MLFVFNNRQSLRVQEGITVFPAGVDFAVLARTGGEEQNRLEPLSLLNMLKHIQERFAPMAAQKNLFIQIATERDIEVRTDRQKIERLIANLVENAVKYTRIGGVTLSACDEGVNKS